MSALALGVDIGGTKILIALVDGHGRVEHEWRVATDAARGGAAVMASVVAGLGAAMRDLSPERRGVIAGIGVSAAGQVDWRTGTIAFASPNIPGWSGMPVRQTLVEAFGLPVTVDNDGNAAAFGEWWAGAGRQVVSVVVITVGTGIGGGIVNDGQVWRGSRWRGGEVGHLVIQAEGIACNCGQTGCLEVYAAGPAIARMATEACPGWHPTTREVFAAAATGDATAVGVLERSARFLAMGVVSLTSVVDPDLFLLGGGVASQPDYLGRIQTALSDSTVSGLRGFDPTRLALASLGESAGAVGAAGELLQSRGLLAIQASV